MKPIFLKNKLTKEVILAVEGKEYGDEYIILKANTTDAAVEKHVPDVSINGNVLTATIGSVVHPMSEEHHIAFIVLETDSKTILKKLEHTQYPSVDFILNENEKPIAVYEYCNLHGLWVKELN